MDFILQWVTIWYEKLETGERITGQLDFGMPSGEHVATANEPSNVRLAFWRLF